MLTRVQEETGKEFLHYDVKDFIQTSDSEDKGQKKETDDDTGAGHGTAVASKALGKIYGVAKGATLISVKLTDDPAGMSDALELVGEAISDDEERAKKSVVIMSKNCIGKEISREDAIKTAYGRELAGLLNFILKRRVPVVLSAGNHRGDIKENDEDKRKKIDTMPPILVDDKDLPLINVGAATLDGKAAPFSQGTGTDELTVFAPGVDVEVLFKAGGKSSKASGTSFGKVNLPLSDAARAEIGEHRQTCLRNKSCSPSEANVRRCKALGQAGRYSNER